MAPCITFIKKKSPILESPQSVLQNKALFIGLKLFEVRE